MVPAARAKEGAEAGPLPALSRCDSWQDRPGELRSDPITPAHGEVSPHAAPASSVSMGAGLALRGDAPKLRKTKHGSLHLALEVAGDAGLLDDEVEEFEQDKFARSSEQPRDTWLRTRVRFQEAIFWSGSNAPPASPHPDWPDQPGVRILTTCVSKS